MMLSLSVEDRKILEPFAEFMPAIDGVPRLLDALEQRYPVSQVLSDPQALRAWELCGLALMNGTRLHDAIALFTSSYEKASESGTDRTGAKGTFLVWLSECFQRLNCPSLANRFLMLTVVEDAIGNKGEVFIKGGSYWRARWVYGMSHGEVESICSNVFAIHHRRPDNGRFPEWVLQELPENWKTVPPSPSEAARYVISRPYAKWLMQRVREDTTGRELETLAQYLMSSIPGCRTRRRALSYSTDYDLVCILEGAPDDFRRDLGRYILCECKDLNEAAGTPIMAKFAYVLLSAKCRFGVLFASNGITGTSRTTDARREQLKVYQDTGIVIVVLDLDELQQVVNGINLVTVLRDKYECIRLDLRSSQA